jgi:hypothetical protein
MPLTLSTLVYTCSLLQCLPTLIAGLIILLIKVAEIFALEFLTSTTYVDSARDTSIWDVHDEHLRRT